MKGGRPYLWILAAFLGAFFILLLLPVAASPTAFGAVLSSLPLGWWHFLKRNISQVTWSWSLIATSLICSVGIFFLGNWLLRALWAQIQQRAHPGQPRQHWPWRWTICIYAGVWLMFAITLGAGGVFRHTSWLLNYRQPWYQARDNSFVRFRQLEGEVRLLALENEEDLTATRKAFYQQTTYRHPQSLIADEFNVIFYGNISNKVAGFLMIPREPKMLARGEFGVSIPGQNDLIRPISELPRALAKLDSAYPQKNSP